jgi:hypothetical protein
MRRLQVISIIGTILFAAACSSSTAPSKVGGSLLFTNHLSVPVYLAWQDGLQVIGRDTIPAGAVARCSRFLAQEDSAYFQITATNLTGGVPATTTYTAPFFDPDDSPAWTVDVSADANGSPVVDVRLANAAC